MKSWRALAVNTKAYNVVLQETIKKLKSPAQLQKYEQQGKLRAEQEFRGLIEERVIDTNNASYVHKMVSEVGIEDIIDGEN